MFVGSRRRGPRLGRVAGIHSHHDESQDRRASAWRCQSHGRIRGWLELPHIHVAQPSETHLERLSTALEQLGSAGNLTTDARLAALAMARGYVLCSTDADFARFTGLRWMNPCKG